MKEAVEQVVDCLIHGDRKMRFDAAALVLELQAENEARKQRLGITIGWWLLIAGIVMFATCCTSSRFHVTPLPSYAERDAVAVHIETTCGAASGVLVDPVHVVTAAHVASCAERPAFQASKMITVTELNGTTHVARVDVVDAKRDLVRLKLERPSSSTRVLRAAPLIKGERVCAATVKPARINLCGDYVGDFAGEAYNGNILTTLPVWFGNSGSPVFDSRGRLAAIVTSIEWCTNADREAYKKDRKYVPPRLCAGYASTLFRSKVMP